MAFELEETTVAHLKAAYQSREVSCREVVEAYLDRIQRFDTNGPMINSIIAVNPRVLEDADHADSQIRRTGILRSLEGVPVILKDQIDTAGMPTTLGSVLFRDYVPDRDATVVTRLKNAGALILAKATLGELGGGDTHGTLYGSTRNPYDRARTVGGSSGGPAAAMSCNFGVIAVGQEAFASIRRPASWTCTVGMRPTSGLVSRAGSYGGGPSMSSSLGPIARCVADLACILDVLVGYDPEDSSTALGVGKPPSSYGEFLHLGALRGARLGVLREPIGQYSEPSSPDFAAVDRSYRDALQELAAGGATLIDPVVIPDIRMAVDQRYATADDVDATFNEYFNRSQNAPFVNAEALRIAAETANAMRPRLSPPRGTMEEGIRVRDKLFIAVLKVMTDLGLDAIVHKSVEHQPTLIADGINPPYVNGKGAPFLNTFLQFLSAMTVPSGFTEDLLPTGITFLGRPYDEGRLIALAYDYEQATRHRRSPTL